MDENAEKLMAATEKSLAEKVFIKLVLSNYKGEARGLRKVTVRLIETKRGPRLMFQSRFETRDVVKNFEFEEGVAEMRRSLESGFRNAHLFTAAADFQLDIGKRNSRLVTGKPTSAKPPNASHDREKRTLIDPNAFYLKALGITDDRGRVKPSQRDKWRQINKFVEILAGLVNASPIAEKPNLKIVDMGSGKGYLTFAAYDYFANVRATTRSGSPPYEGGVAAASADGVVLSTLPKVDLDLTKIEPPRQTAKNAACHPSFSKEGSRNEIQMTGVEARPDLVATCNDVARAGGFDGLRFVQGQIADFDPGDVDVLIALHACDTATDDALFKGISANASIIVAAPCCHKEVRKQIRPPETLAGILKHGIMLERTAETITDGLRALLLEREGYATKLFEFVPTEHTPKNNMLVGTKTSKTSDAARQISDIKLSYGISKLSLEELLDRKAERQQ